MIKDKVKIQMWYYLDVIFNFLWKSIKVFNIVPKREKPGFPRLYLYWEQSTLLRLSHLPQGIWRESRLCLIKVHLMIAGRFVFKGTFSYINEEKLKCSRGRYGRVKKWLSDLGLLLNQLEVWLKFRHWPSLQRSGAVPMDLLSSQVPTGRHCGRSWIQDA